MAQFIKVTQMNGHPVMISTAAIKMIEMTAAEEPPRIPLRPLRLVLSL